MRISDWSSDVCSSVLLRRVVLGRKRIVRRGIAHAQHDHALRRAPQRLRAAPLIGAFCHPLHRAVTSLAQPLFEAARTQRIVGGGANAEGDKAEPFGLGLQPLAQAVVYHSINQAWGCSRSVMRVNRRPRSEEHTSELQSLMRISYAV